MEQENVLTGSCLCRNVQFEIDGPIEILMHCHCSLCRKTSGSASNSVVFLPIEKFRWISGKSETTQLDVTTSTAKGDRRVIICNSCGSPLPDSYDGKSMCIPVGLIDNHFEPKLVINHHLADKGWSLPSPQNVLNFEEWYDKEQISEIVQKWK